MREAIGDLWTFPAHIRVITTNGDINRHGELVMGRGVARQAKEKFPGIAVELGDRVRVCGNTVVGVIQGDVHIWTFPVKHHWSEAADLDLIRVSAEALVRCANTVEPVWRETGKLKTGLEIVMPRPGCGNGQRTWSEVKPILTDLLDDRFVVLIWSTANSIAPKLQT